MGIDDLHPDIVAIEAEIGRETVEVIDPSPGLWGGDPVPGLVRVVYQCPEAPSQWCGMLPHTHHALYGPKLRASCGRTHPGCNHELVPSGEPGYALYAD